MGSICADQTSAVPHTHLGVATRQLKKNNEKHGLHNTTKRGFNQRLKVITSCTSAGEECRQHCHCCPDATQLVHAMSPRIGLLLVLSILPCGSNGGCRLTVFVEMNGCRRYSLVTATQLVLVGALCPFACERIDFRFRFPTFRASVSTAPSLLITALELVIIPTCPSRAGNFFVVWLPCVASLASVECTSGHLITATASVTICACSIFAIDSFISRLPNSARRALVGAACTPCLATTL